MVASLLTSLMAKTSKKSAKTDWKTLATTIVEELAGDLPWFVELKENIWTAFDVKPATMVKGKDGGPEGEWSCIRVKIETNEEDGWYVEEVPFWAMNEFLETILEADEDQDEVSMSFKRVKKGGVNKAYFQVN